LLITYKDYGLDVVLGEGEGATRILPEVDEDVDEVATVLGRQRALRVQVLLDDRLEEGVELPEDPLAAGGEAGEAVDEAADRSGKQVLGGGARAGEHVHDVVERVLEAPVLGELVAAVDAAERHRADDPVGEAQDVLVQRHRLPFRAVQGARQPLHLVAARVPRRPDAARAEELNGEELARLAPVGAVGREGHVLEVVGEPPRARGDGPRAAVDVVGPERLPRRLRRRQHHGRRPAEPQPHHRPVDPRQVAQGPVRQRAELVQVAQEGHRGGPRWQLDGPFPGRRAAAAPPPAPRQQQEGDGSDKC
jgi:hypothetical protein